MSNTITTIIRTYQGKLGTVTVTKYDDGNYGITYHVKHHGLAPGINSYWSSDKVSAIKYAQFYAGKY